MVENQYISIGCPHFYQIAQISGNHVVHGEEDRLIHEVIPLQCKW